MPQRTMTVALLLLVGLLLTACGGATPAAQTPATQAPAALPPAGAAPAAPAAPATNAQQNAAAVRTFTIDPSLSNAAYAVEEEFFGRQIPFVQTVGSTQTIDGQIQFVVNEAVLEQVGGAFTVDLRTLASDSGRRDNALRDRWLQSNSYPLATYTVSGVSELPEGAALGAEVAFNLDGEMTIREITNPWTWEVVATLDGETLTGVATGFFYMRDFGFEPPDIAGMLRVTDGVTTTVTFVANEVK